MCQEGSQKTNKIKIWQFKLDILGFPKGIFASISHSLHSITLSFEIVACYKEWMHLNLKFLSILESQFNPQEEFWVKITKSYNSPFIQSPSFPTLK